MSAKIILIKTVTGLIGIAVGALYAIIGSIGFTQFILIGNWNFPWGLIAAIIGFSALAIGVRLLCDRYTACFCGVGAWLILLVFSSIKIGGSVVIEANILGIIWILAVPVATVAAVAFPFTFSLKVSKTHNKL